MTWYGLETVTTIERKDLDLANLEEKQKQVYRKIEDTDSYRYNKTISLLKYKEKNATYDIADLPDLIGYESNMYSPMHDKNGKELNKIDAMRKSKYFKGCTIYDEMKNVFRERLKVDVDTINQENIDSKEPNSQQVGNDAKENDDSQIL